MGAMELEASMGCVGAGAAEEAGSDWEAAEAEAKGSGEGDWPGWAATVWRWVGVI